MLVCRGDGDTATRAMVSINGASYFLGLYSACPALGSVSSLGLGEVQVSAEVTPSGACLDFGSGGGGVAAAAHPVPLLGLVGRSGGRNRLM